MIFDASTVLALLGTAVGGITIGICGIGGVLVVPSLLLAGLDAHVALNAALAAFIPAAFVGMVGHWSVLSSVKFEAIVLFVATTPAAFLAALLLSNIPSLVVKVLVIVPCFYSALKGIYTELQSCGKHEDASVDVQQEPGHSGLHGEMCEAIQSADHAIGHTGQHTKSSTYETEPRTCFPNSDDSRTCFPASEADAVSSLKEDSQAQANQPIEGPVGHHLSVVLEEVVPEVRDKEGASLSCYQAGLLSAAGVLVGLGSPLTATGGPLIWTALALALFPEMKMAQIVVLCMVVSVPVAIFSTLGNLMFSSVALDWAIALGVVLALSVAVGSALSKHISHMWLKRGVSVLLLAVGIATVIKVLMEI